MADTPPQRFLKLDQVGEELNISANQVYALVRRGDLRAIKIGGRGQWRVERDRLEEYIQKTYAETRAFIEAHPVEEDATPELGTNEAPEPLAAGSRSPEPKSAGHESVERDIASSNDSTATTQPEPQSLGASLTDRARLHTEDTTRLKASTEPQTGQHDPAITRQPRV